MRYGFFHQPLGRHNETSASVHESAAPGAPPRLRSAPHGGYLAGIGRFKSGGVFWKMSLPPPRPKCVIAVTRTAAPALAGRAGRVAPGRRPSAADAVIAIEDLH